MDGLEHAANICEDKHYRIVGMLETFETKPECYKHVSIDSVVLPYKLF